MMQRNEAPNSTAADADQQLDAADRLRDDAHEEPTHQRKVRGSSYALSVRAKYALSDDDYHNSISGHNEYVLQDHEKHMGNFAEDCEITLPHHDEQIMGFNRKLPLRAKYSYATTNHHHADHHKHDRHGEHNAKNDTLSQLHEVASAEHHRKREGRIAVSTLQAARAQAAELRALHSVVLNSSLGTDHIQNGMVHTQRPMPIDDRMVQSKLGRANKKKSKIYHNLGGGKEEPEDIVQGALSSASSASSTADCFIRPLHEYPVFMPHISQEDILVNASMDHDVPSLHRRSSVDTYEAAMRDERLHYIFDHDNKRSFSGMHNIDHDQSVRDNSSTMSCLHESLNLPPRSTAALLHLRNNGDHPLHHMSLNLPQGSQHHIFKSSMQNPLFDSNSIVRINKKSSHHLDDGSAYSPSFKRFSDDLNAKPKKDNQPDKNANAHEATLPDFTTRQRALIEFLSEEPARMRAFNELAAKEAAQNYDVRHPSTAGKTIPVQKTIQEVKHTGKSESSARHVEQVGLHGGVSGHHHHHQHHHEPVATDSIQQMRQRLNHALKNGHPHQTGSVSCDKCRPAGGFPTVVPLTDPSEVNAINSAGNALIKARPEQLKKPSIKGWFFRGKKKQNNVDHSTHPATPPSSRDRTPLTSGTFSASKLEQLSNTSTTAPTSHVFPGLATSEAEKELEVAMAMDLMELKVLQANTKRDAAMAEVLELRLAMDSMAKKLVEVERHCESLKSQLLDVQILREIQIGPHRKTANPVSKRIDAEVGDEDDIVAADCGHAGAGTGVVTDGEDDFCESDSHDNRKERSAAASKIRTDLQSSGYGGGRSGRNSRDMTQPKKEELLSAVAEARVGVKQVSRVLLQHVQESMGRGTMVEIEEEEAEGAAEQWRPILMLCREARRAEKGGSSRSREVGYCIEALISLAFYEHFENVGFDKSGAHQILEPAQRALAFYHSFLKLAKFTPTQLLTQSSALYNPAFDRFCSRKMRALGRAVGCPGRFWPDELARTFLSAARAVWLLHHLAFAYPTCPPGIFRVAAHSPFDARFMELLPTDSGHAFPSTHLVVSLMVIPGFFLSDDVIKCKVLA